MRQWRGRGGDCHDHTIPRLKKERLWPKCSSQNFSSSYGKGRGGGHGHTQPSLEGLPSSSGKYKGWWSWSYTSFLCKASLLFWESAGVVVRIVVGAPAIVVHLHEVWLGVLVALYDHDHHRWHFQAKESFAEGGSV